MILGQHEMPCQIWFQAVNFYDLPGEFLELSCSLGIESQGLLTELGKQASQPKQESVCAVTHQRQRVVPVSGFIPR
jgi:hypothetical protein